ncbi:MAG: energy-coupling factor ABC transporter ATP-binding protein [Egibacteraceae bacterium]
MTVPSEAIPPAVELDDVGFAYPDGHVALDGVTLDIAAGERVAVLGPNGAGKSTLCLHLNGILRPQRGAVTVCGVPVDGRDVAEARRRVGVVFQDPDDMLFMPTVAQDVAFGPANLGLERAVIAARVDRALDMVGMGEHRDRPPHHLSFGQRKRVAAAAALSMEPDVLVLDEPSSNLDPRARREFGEILAQLDQTLIMVTHDLPYACQLCDRAVVIDHGRIVADGPILGLLADAELLAGHALEWPAGFSLSAFQSPAPSAAG